MSRELNPPEEMARRLVFVLYLFGWASAGVTGLIGLLQGRAPLLLVAGTLFLACFFLKRIGYRHLEFRRLLQSFPYGHQRDSLPSSLRQEIEQIASEFNSPATPWQRRQELRQRLAELVRREPLLLELYPGEIAEIHAGLLHRRSHPEE